MTENKQYGNFSTVRSPFKRFSCVVLLCAVLTLGGCSGLDFPSLPSIPGFGDDDESNRGDETMKDEVSYLEERKKPQHGVNPKNIFGKSLRNNTERIDRLERALQNLQNEFDQAQPSIHRLTALESEIQRLIKELKALNSGDSGTAPATDKAEPQRVTGFGVSPTVSKRTKNTPSPKVIPDKAVAEKAPVKSYQKKSSPNIANGAASVFDVRVGEHPNKTRIVIDVSSTTKFNIDIDNNENIMIIELPQAEWSATKSKSFSKSNFISSYRVEASENGHMMILQLKRNAKVVYKDDLKGNTGNSRRLVIDLGGT